jgi:hypothetical protein
MPLMRSLNARRVENVFTAGAQRGDYARGASRLIIPFSTSGSPSYTPLLEQVSRKRKAIRRHGMPEKITIEECSQYRRD